MTGSVIAYIGDGDRYWPLIERAFDVAERRGSPLILYNADAASMFSNPLPTWWSADGEKEQFGERLDPEQLEKAGYEDLSQRVVSARSRGIDAFGWLPSKRDAHALAEYADNQGADLLVVPSSLDQKGLVDWIKGRPTTDQVAEETDLPLVVVELEPETAKA
jgi:nucleotide-binding universal stress UspA family protein